MLVYTNCSRLHLQEKVERLERLWRSVYQTTRSKNWGINKMAKYNQKIIREICKHISEGCSNKDAASLVAISEETFYSWQKSKPEFSESIKKAQASRKQHLIRLIFKAAEKQWQAAAWYLERVYPEEFAVKREKTTESQYSETITGENIFEHFAKRAQQEQSKDLKISKSSNFDVK